MEAPSDECNNYKQEMTIEIIPEKLIHQGESTTFIPVDFVTKYSPSVCEVCQGTGFLGKFWCNNAFVYGLFTNNHVLMENLLDGRDPDAHVILKFDSEATEKIKLQWKDKFQFTCPVLDVTFIHIDHDLVTKLQEESGREFLTVCDSWMEKEGDQLTVIQYPSGCSGLQVASGAFHRMYGFDILHKVSTNHGSSGSPLMTHDGKVIGIHKGSAAKDSDQYNIAVSANAVLAAIYNFKTLPQRLISNPRKLEEQYEYQILQQNLVRMKDRCIYGTIYKSPTTDHDCSISDKYVGPVWFIPTSHGWYWTPTDPFDKQLDINWMSVHNSKIMPDNIKLAEKNIVIIKWLEENNNVM